MKPQYRFDIDVELVQMTINKQISQHSQFLENFEKNNHRFYEGRAAEWDKDLKSMTRLYNNCIKYALDYYSKVRIIRLKHKRGNKFVLVYGDMNDNDVKGGTGPFATVQSAQDWFVGGGR